MKQLSLALFISIVSLNANAQLFKKFYISDMIQANWIHDKTEVNIISSSDSSTYTEDKSSTLNTNNLSIGEQDLLQTEGNNIEVINSYTAEYSSEVDQRKRSVKIVIQDIASSTCISVVCTDEKNHSENHTKKGETEVSSSRKIGLFHKTKKAYKPLQMVENVSELEIYMARLKLNTDQQITDRENIILLAEKAIKDGSIEIISRFEEELKELQKIKEQQGSSKI